MSETDEVKVTRGILGLIGEDTQLRRVANTNGGEHAGPCPWCAGNDRFRVWPALGRYWCRRCRRSGDAIQYLRDRRGLSFREACNLLKGACLTSHNDSAVPSDREARDEHRPPDMDWQKRGQQVVRACEAVLWEKDGEKARRYLREMRGLNDDTIRKYRLGYHPRGGNLHGLWVERGVTIPCFVDGVLWCVKIRTSSDKPQEKYRHVRGGRAALFGLSNVSGHSTAFLCEGEFDAMLLDQEAGDVVGVIALGGVANSLTQWMLRLLSLKRIFLALDLDGSGRTKARELAAISKRMRRAPLPPVGDKVNDITDYWREGGNLRDWALYRRWKDGCPAPHVVPTLPASRRCPVTLRFPPGAHVAAIGQRWHRLPTGEIEATYTTEDELALCIGLMARLSRLAREGTATAPEGPLQMQLDLG